MSQESTSQSSTSGEAQETTADTWSDVNKTARQTVVRAVVGSILAGGVAAALALWAIVETIPGKVGLMPKGAVAAFDFKGGCPTGWEPYEHAWGRFIIGAVTLKQTGKIDKDFASDTRGEAIKERRFGEPGGEQRTVLDIDNMPNHNHGGYTNYDATGNEWDPSDTKPLKGGFGSGSHRIVDSKHRHSIPDEGKNKPHNNMPPYVALHYCKKT